MVGSPVVAAFIARWTFWVLLVVGWTSGELQPRAIAIFILLWLAGFVGFRFVLDGLLFAPYVAILDIALVFAIFKGDVRLT